MPRSIPLETRFWSKVSKGASPNDCWLWIGACSSNPKWYGKIGTVDHRGRSVPRNAHAVSFEIHFGPIPKGLEVCHRCDNRHCVNPAHLWLGTHKQNMLDAQAKGRMGMPRRLSADVINAIRNSSGRYGDIAHRFNVHKGTVSLIKNGNYLSKKPRHAKPGRPPKMSLSQVEAVKRASGTQKEIAQRFDISQMQVSIIKRGVRTKVYAAEAAA